MNALPDHSGVGAGRTRLFGQMAPGARPVVIVGVLALVAVGAIWAVLSSRHTAAAGTTVHQTSGRSGMTDMSGGRTPGARSVALTTDQIRQFGVTFGAVTERPLTTAVRTTGVVTVDETRLAQVSPKIGGFVERLYVNVTGQPVRRGQPLLEIYSPDLVAAQQELLVADDLQRDVGPSALPGVPEASINLVEAATRRLQLWDISQGQINEILKTRRVHRTLILYAPVSGVVMDKKVVQGQSIRPGEQLYTIADLSDVWVDVELREVDAAAVRIGSSADIEFAGLPGRAFKGRVEYVYPTLQTETRTVRARVAAANTGGALKPGMYATVRLSTPTRVALTVPTSAVLHTGDRNIVFVDMGKGELMPHEVELGRTAGEYTEVLAGAGPGQRVVTAALFLLDSESNVGEVMKAMISQMSSGDLGKSQDMRDMPGMPMPGMNDRGADVRGTPRPPPTSTPERR